jgi:hypothetical protein
MVTSVWQWLELLTTEVEALSEILPQCRFGHHKSDKTLPELQLWVTVDWPPELWHELRSVAL